MADATGPFSRFKALIATSQLPLLGPQRRPGTLGEGEIDRRLNEFFACERISSGVQSLLRSAALLWHDHLDASHTVSQNIETQEGSWLHGIMHRREPDYGNAKYWFRRVGQHGAYPRLAESVAELLEPGGGKFNAVVKNGDWMPLVFIDECERAEQGNDAVLTATLQKIQAVEFDVLVEHILSKT